MDRAPEKHTVILQDLDFNKLENELNSAISKVKNIWKKPPKQEKYENRIQ